MSLCNKTRKYSKKYFFKKIKCKQLVPDEKLFEQEEYKSKIQSFPPLISEHELFELIKILLSNYGSRASTPKSKK